MMIVMNILFYVKFPLGHFKLGTLLVLPWYAFSHKWIGSGLDIAKYM